MPQGESRASPNRSYDQYQTGRRADTPPIAQHASASTFPSLSASGSVASQRPPSASSLRSQASQVRLSVSPQNHESPVVQSFSAGDVRRRSTDGTAAGVAGSVRVHSPSVDAPSSGRRFKHLVGEVQFCEGVWRYDGPKKLAYFRWSFNTWKDQKLARWGADFRSILDNTGASPSLTSQIIQCYVKEHEATMEVLNRQYPVLMESGHDATTHPQLKSMNLTLEAAETQDRDLEALEQPSSALHLSVDSLSQLSLWALELIHSCLLCESSIEKKSSEHLEKLKREVFESIYRDEEPAINKQKTATRQALKQVFKGYIDLCSNAYTRSFRRRNWIDQQLRTVSRAMEKKAKPAQAKPVELPTYSAASAA